MSILGGLIHKVGLAKLGASALPSAVFGDVPFIVKWDMSGGNIYHSLHHKERASNTP
jgi:hypothetical protein